MLGKSSSQGEHAPGCSPRARGIRERLVEECMVCGGGICVEECVVGGGVSRPLPVAAEAGALTLTGGLKRLTLEGIAHAVFINTIQLQYDCL